MTPCELRDTADIELYFYGEFDPVDRARVESHLRGCEACRMRLEDLQAIRRALASRPAVDAPPAGDWSGFMRRLDSAIAREAPRLGSGPAEPSKVTTFGPRNLESADSWNLRYVLVIAATLALVTIGVLMAMRFEPAAEISVAGKTPVTAPVTDSTLVTSGVRSPQVDRALRESSAEHLERSKLVVLGLATRDPRGARAQDWQYERTLAGSLLSETRLYRQAALQGGASDVARVMRDLETVLLEASMSDRKDPAALERVQRLIAKRDLVVKMQVIAAGHAGN
jgi:Putative zinc-finger